MHQDLFIDGSGAAPRPSSHGGGSCDAQGGDSLACLLSGELEGDFGLAQVQLVGLLWNLRRYEGDSVHCIPQELAHAITGSRHSCGK